VIAEGLAAGLKVIVSDIAGPVEVIDGGRLGLVVEKENPEALMRGVLLMCGKKPDRVECRRAMKELYSIETQVCRYRKAYQETINRVRGYNKTGL